MTESINKKKRHLGITITLVILFLVFLGGFFLYQNFNRMLSEALLRSFNSNIVSDVYELKFEKLRVNIFEGNIEVMQVVLQPRSKPLRNYDYINSSFSLKTGEMKLLDVALFKLLRDGELELDKILINKPEVQLNLEGANHVLFPFKDSTNISKKEKGKRSIDSFKLSSFKLLNANFYGNNGHKHNAFTIEDLSISLKNLNISQVTGRDLYSVKDFELTLGAFSGKMKKAALKQLAFKTYRLKIDSLRVQKTKDTVIYHFDELTTGLNDLDIQTADSIFHVTLGSIQVSYKDKNIRLSHLNLKPNVSAAALQKNYRYQHAQFYGSVGEIAINQLNFDSLIYRRKIFVGEILIDSAALSIFKDKLKPVDKNRFPPYPGQQIAGIRIPLQIKSVKAKHVNLESVERKPDSSYAKVKLGGAAMEIRNITNLSKSSLLVMNANATIEGKAHFSAHLEFDYTRSRFHFRGKVDKFDLPDLNPLIQAYTPAKINTGKVDGITFSGLAEHNKATGSMTFLYHDLEVDLELRNKAKWKSSAIAFAANSLLPSANPASGDSPPRTVRFTIERDMNKAFINVLIKSLLAGFRETMIMSKENKKANRAAKKEKQKKDRGK